MVDRFLLPRAENSLMLISNSRTEGLEDHGKIFQGMYAAYRNWEEITGAVAHYRDSMVVFQAPENAAGLFHAVLVILFSVTRTRKGIISNPLYNFFFGRIQICFFQPDSRLRNLTPITIKTSSRTIGSHFSVLIGIAIFI
jgi:hypothetical protein